MLHHDHPWQFVSLEEEKGFKMGAGCHLSFHLPILLRLQWMENKAKRETKAERFVLLKVRHKWVKQEEVETDDVSQFPLDNSGRNEKQMTTLSPTHCHVNDMLIETVKTFLYPCNNTDVGGNSLVLELTFALV